MKVVYILALGHSGSTLLDCILGTHSNFISSGELKHLQWQLYRTLDKKATVENQDICTCEKDFRECDYWSEVFSIINKEKSIDITKNPKKFNTRFFSNFIYGKKRNLFDRIKGYVIREWLELGYSITFPKLLEPTLDTQIKNKWLLYQAMAGVANKSVVIDSSKDLVQALIMQKSYPKDVYIIFLHREALGIASSAKKYNHSIPKTLNGKKIFSKRVNKYKKNIKNLKSIELVYEDIVKNPAATVAKIGSFLNEENKNLPQRDDDFYIDPQSLHIVAGNPMRYRGIKKVKYDNSWKKRLEEKEIDLVKKIMGQYF